MPAELPLSTLLSQVLVAFTIEFDNEAERQIPHCTTRHGGSGGAWLVSMVMYLNCMRFVGEDGITVRKVEELARTKTNWHGMQRWGYIKVEPDPADARANHERTAPPRPEWLVRATRRGRMARKIWRPLFGLIEERWRERFGDGLVHQLRESLFALTRQFPVDLPDCLPILTYGLFSNGWIDKGRAPTNSDDGTSRHLVSLLSRVLLALAIEFERQSELSLAVSANVLRVLDEKGMRVRDLPVLTGVSKESISMAIGFLEKRGIAVVETDRDGGKGKVARLTAAGREAQDAYRLLLVNVEERWRERFGSEAIEQLRDTLKRFVGDPSRESPLFQGLMPHPENWRASIRPPKTLPHYPMVLHRGGYPDGS